MSRRKQWLSFLNDCHPVSDVFYSFMRSRGLSGRHHSTTYCRRRKSTLSCNFMVRISTCSNITTRKYNAINRLSRNDVLNLTRYAFMEATSSTSCVAGANGRVLRGINASSNFTDRCTAVFASEITFCN